MPTQRLRTLFLATAIGVLAGCGGSDDDGGAATAPTPSPAPPAATAIERYTGNWTVCNFDGPTASEFETLQVTRTSDTTASFTVDSKTYATSNCTGTVVRSDASSGTISIVGTKAIGTETVDKVNVAAGGSTEKQVFVVRGDGRFFTGIPTDETGSNPDAEGYPSALDNQPFVRP
ncbi:hypothetical protein FN976_14805 [Caenimonas sedimenti]|uniref:Lipocalin family protein n=1 Tax=Caenimonas sedimenti TaxID=2596921 RepID=A0A562ZNY9_9BURK|nr:hypothetical protein [Caenimonas sedimenti]TWO70263.1 hypothetical protein FN976_14805 [Caenimonas sedimenti]